MFIPSSHHLCFKNAITVFFFLTTTPFLVSHSSSSQDDSFLPTKPHQALHIGAVYIEEANKILSNMKEEALALPHLKKQYEIFTSLVENHLHKAHTINPHFGYLTTINHMKKDAELNLLKKNPLEDFLKNYPLIMIMAASCVTLKSES